MMIVTSLSTPSTVDIWTKVKTLAHVPVVINNHQLTDLDKKNYFSAWHSRMDYFHTGFLEKCPMGAVDIGDADVVLVSA